jgi:glycosyltransferase involved in cell wall biosynthesis
VNGFKPDIVHCNSSVAGYWGRSAIKNSLPTVFTAHGWVFTDGAIWWRKIVGIISERRMSEYCSKIICVSENDRQIALKHRIAPEEKFITIHNGIDIESWENICEKKEIEKRKLENTPYFKQIRIVFVARLAMPKDPITLIEAFSQLPESLKQESNIFIVGDGPDKELLKNLIKDLGLENKIYLLGGMDREELKMIYLSGDIYVLTTKYEGFPYTIIEAMSYGLPVIVSDVGGCSEAVDPNCGFLIKRGDVDGVKNALAKLIISKELREKMGKAGYEKAREQFALTTMLQATEAVYKEVLGQK